MTEEETGIKTIPKSSTDSAERESKDHLRVFVAEAGTSEVANSASFEVLRKTLVAINACGRISRAYQENPVKDQFSLLSRTDDIETDSRILRNICQLAVPSDSTASELLLQQQEERFNEIAHQEELRYGRHFPTETAALIIPDEKTLKELTQTLADLRHDLKNAMCTLLPRVQMARRGINIDIALENINYSFNKVGELTESATSLIEKSYPKEKLSTSDVAAALKECLKKNNPAEKSLSISVIESEESQDSIVIWSQSWISRLAANIAQNTLKAYDARDELSPEKAKGPRILLASMRTTKSENGARCLRIEVDNRAIKMPDEIIKNGFQRGLSFWPGSSLSGEGRGMASDSKTLQEQYGGTIKAENIANQAGEIIGARIIIEVPIVKDAPVAYPY
ncbi:MAG TPA: hypothetical protein DDZ05_04365 [Candidatus Blackburnbacteria bacterium]|nr:hypothetical protein [Candidatus Blackburnbacteria bacterium]